MHIMTKDGWRQLVVKTEVMPNAPEMYYGPIPSFECKALIAKYEREHREWQAKRKSMRK